MRSLLLGAGALLLLGVIAPACSSDAGVGVGDSEPDEGGTGTVDGSGPGTEDGSVPDPTTDSGGPAGPSCTNKKKDGTETDVDCGGTCATKCIALQKCAMGGDCTSGLVCVKQTCSSPAANDGVKDGTETDIDCGGDAAPPCEVDKACLDGDDCVEKICSGAKKCSPSAPNDAVQNGKETDIDCGGGAPAPACPATKKCKLPADCASGVCTGLVCQAPLPNDGVQNANETDIDCGGGAPAAACGTDKKCITGTTDCVSLVCTGNVCKAATGTDNVKNGDESDKDCGGTNTGAPKCGATLLCNSHADCLSNGCAYNGRCAVGRSCTKQIGGVTCGVGEVGEGGAVHESCCTQAQLAGSAVTIDKYFVTAGRMRAFIERLNGDVRTFAPGTAGWSAAWNMLVPSTIAEANTQLGSYWNGAPNDTDGNASKRSCQPQFFGGHTYYTSGAGEAGDYTQDILDPKALNCVGWHIARAFCAWDGGRLPTGAEIANAFTNNGTTAYPWQFQGPLAYDETGQDPRLNHEFNYGYPGVPRRVPANTGTVQDITWYVSPPGRFPTGANAKGVQDIAGDLLHWVNDGQYDFTWTESWEHHGKNLVTSNWITVTDPMMKEPNGYYGIGFRCAH